MEGMKTLLTAEIAKFVGCDVGAISTAMRRNEDCFIKGVDYFKPGRSLAFTRLGIKKLVMCTSHSNYKNKLRELVKADFDSVREQLSLAIKNTPAEFEWTYNKWFQITSLNVAENFGIEHCNLLAKIKEIFEKLNNAPELNFWFVKDSYVDQIQHVRPMYKISTDGFMLLVASMGKNLAVETYKGIQAYKKAFKKWMDEDKAKKQATTKPAESVFEVFNKEEELYTPEELSEKAGLKVEQFQVRLAKAGLQKRSRFGWQPTEAGMYYGNWKIFEEIGTKSKLFCWKETVLSKIKEDVVYVD